MCSAEAMRSVRVIAASRGMMVGAREARLLKDLPRDKRRVEKGVVLLLTWEPSSATASWTCPSVDLRDWVAGGFGCWLVVGDTGGRGDTERVGSRFPSEAFSASTTEPASRLGLMIVP